MSHRLTDRIARGRGEVGDSKGFAIRADVASVHAVQSISLKGSEAVCESPVCDVSFPQTGLKIEPKRFCSDDCRQQASLIRRVSKLLENETDERVIEILRGKP